MGNTPYITPKAYLKRNEFDYTNWDLVIYENSLSTLSTLKSYLNQNKKCLLIYDKDIVRSK